MKTVARYVVTVNPPDEHPGFVRVYGPFRNLSEAESFRDCVRDAVEAISKNVDDSTGFAYIQDLEPPRRRAAKLWATRGERATVSHG